ncbi:hypothetical protein [Paraurantiacibacter namhicola]|uniref:Uncharacterized protein n=1 Tax=Paraurantiacibacter namhicola TaxID=645517 RepID=A0A1C7D6G4_9SPHN|nr:hypothetical protein [Paraurantiacibacter namhicola]ANU07057.1 hypothetical protein A6F65_00736 [Paraurantiacibacter namhicola]
MRKLTGFILFALAWLAALVAVHRSVPDPELEYRIERLDAALEAKGVIMGGSAAIGLEPAALGIDAVEVWNPNQDVLETAALANLLLDRNPELELVVITLAAPAHALDNGGRGSCCVDQRNRTYRAMRHYGDWSLVGGDWRTAVSSLVPMGEADWLPLLARLGLANGKPAGRAASQEAWRARSMAHAPTAEELDTLLDGRATEIETLAYRDPQIASRNGQALAALARRFTSRGGRMVVIVPPLHASLQQRMEQDFMAWRRGMDTMLTSAEAGGAQVLDLSGHRALAEDRLNFSDPVHLNRRGGRALARELRKSGAV